MHLDTTAIVEMLLSPPTSRRFQQVVTTIGEDPVFVSMVQVAELADWCIANGKDPATILQRLKSAVTLSPLTEQICLDGAKLKREIRGTGRKRKFGLLDGIVLASARALGQKLLTFDQDFRDLPDAVVLG